MNDSEKYYEHQTSRKWSTDRSANFYPTCLQFRRNSQPRLARVETTGQPHFRTYPDSESFSIEGVLCLLFLIPIVALALSVRRQDQFQTIATIATVLLAITVASRAAGDEVMRWNQVATDATATANTNPLTESCVLAILHVAIHDAVNALESRYEPYQPRTSPAPAGASVEAAIASAANATLVALLPQSKVSFDAALEETLRTIADDSRKTAGLEVGRAAAAAILKARETDGQKRAIEYTPGTKPGDYRPTAPDFKPAAMAHWGSVTPFVLESSAQFRCAEPPALNSSRALADLEEVKRRSEARASRGPPNRARSAAIGTKVRLKVGTGLHAKYWRHGNSTCGRTPGC